MAYKFLPSYLKTAKTNEKDAFYDYFQNTLNAEFYNSPNWYTIKEEKPFASGIYTDVDVHVVHGIIGETGANQMDDFKTILFKDITHDVALGYMYYFNENYWITSNSDTIKSLNASAILKRCNNTLRWMDAAGKLHSVPCSIGYLIKENRDYSTSGSSLVIPSGFIQIMVQGNSETALIEPNQRFLFGRPEHWIAYKMLGGGIGNFDNLQTMDNTSAKLIRLYMMDNFINVDTDDLVNGIADIKHNVYQIILNRNSIVGNIGQSIQLSADITLNGASVDRDVVWSSSDPTVATVDGSGLVSILALGTCQIQCALSGNVAINSLCGVDAVSTAVSNYAILLNPNSNYVLEGQKKTFEVALYSGSVKQGDAITFSINANGVPSNNYMFDVIDGNHFSITNFAMYLQSDLIITCSTGNTTQQFNIKLRGSW